MDSTEVSKSIVFFKKSLPDRKAEADKILNEHPDRIPILLRRIPDSLPTFKQFKYLVHKDITYGNFLFIVRKRINVDASQALFMFVNDNTLPNSSSTLGEIYNKCKGEDNFLTFTITTEKTFG